MNTSRVLLAGATGAIGHEVLRLLREKNHFVRALSRRQTNATNLRPLANDVVTTDATDANAGTEGGQAGTQSSDTVTNAEVEENRKEHVFVV